jgi:putative endopeptidase
VIPADKPSVGGFMDLSDDVEKTLMKDFGAMLQGAKQPDNQALTNFLEFYRLASDFEARNAAGAEPLRPYMEMVENLKDLADFADQWAQWDLQGMPAPFGVGVMADMGDASANALYLSAPGLFLMDKSYYADEATKSALQDAYQQMSTNLLVMAGKTKDEAAKIVGQALAFDESLVPYVKRRGSQRLYQAVQPHGFCGFCRANRFHRPRRIVQAAAGEGPPNHYLHRSRILLPAEQAGKRRHIPGDEELDAGVHGEPACPLPWR